MLYKSICRNEDSFRKQIIDYSRVSYFNKNNSNAVYLLIEDSAIICIKYHFI